MPGKAFIIPEGDLDMTMTNEDEDELWGDDWVLIDGGSKT